MTDATPKILAERLKSLATMRKRGSFCMEEPDEILSSLPTPDKRSRSCSFDSAFCGGLSTMPIGVSCMSPVPIGSEASSREASPDSTTATTTNSVLDGVPDALKGRLPKSIPIKALVTAMVELPQGARHTLSTSIMAWRQGRMSEAQVMAFVRSVSWQSAALRAAMGEEKAAPEQELLSPQDLSDLLLSAPSSPQRHFATFSLRPISKLGAASPPHSPAMAPQIPACVPEEGDVEEAVRLVRDDALLDSLKTQRLGALLLRSPELQRGFLGNGWNAVAGRFEGLPDWGRALRDIQAHCFDK